MVSQVSYSEIAEEWRKLKGQAAPANFIEAYFPRFEPGAPETDARALAAAAARHYALGLEYDGTTPVISIDNPPVDSPEFLGNHTVIAMVLADMPHLVASVVNDLASNGHAIRLVHHPILAVEGQGSQLSILSRAEAPAVSADTAGLPMVGETAVSDADGPVQQSWIRIEIDRVPEDELAGIEERLRTVLSYVGAASGDASAMADRAREIAAQLRSRPPRPELAGEAESAAELLDWLDGHFTFLGYREYDYSHSGETSELEPIEHTSLGISALRPLTKSKLGQAVAAKALEPHVLVLTKANSRSRVIRGSFMDYIGVKTFDEAGQIVGERRFVGLFKPEFYNDSVLNIPIISRKVRRILSASGFPAGSHSANELLGILETYPRDDLMHDRTEAIFDIVMQIVDMQERRQTRVFIRRDPYQRFVSVILYLPRDLYDTGARVRVQEVLRGFYHADSVDFDVLLSESALARIHFVARVSRSGELPDIDEDAVRNRIIGAVRSWSEDVHAFLAPTEKWDTGNSIARANKWARAFPPSYKEYHTPAEAVADITRFEALDGGGGPIVHLYRPGDDDDASVRLALYRSDRIGLSEVLPFLTAFGATVLDERPHELDLPDGTHRYIYDFGLRFDEELDDADYERISQAFMAGWEGRKEAGVFDRLIVSGLDWKSVTIIRALGKYLRQAGFTYSDAYVGEVYSANPVISGLLVDYFAAKFDPDVDDSTREDTMAELNRSIESALTEVASLDADRVLRSSLELLRATVRTNYYINGSGELPTALVLKIRANELNFVPKPRPALEMWVYSPQVEGVHLRFGTVARGGLRWSDRRDDFRTEVLGLVKAQMVKNALIVPTGAKGGFFPKQLPPMSDRDAWMAAGQAAYEVFIESLLEVADNLVYAEGAQEVVHPDRVVRHDGDDYYLVVAADKGTARFSDVANAIAERRGFWLGDAFASGGSVGYDHKKMAITSRGAWKSVERHFRELGVNTAKDDFTVVGIGDMSGDVFGNGMLRSEHIRLVAAFDHRDIFLDPNPDAAAGYTERQRLFDLPRSSWQDYDRSLISAGGGVFPRSAKSIDLSPEAAAALGVEPGGRSPAQLMSEILRAPVDLLYNGGIGTYIKSGDESHGDVGDKANDPIRIDGSELRCRVVGEGGNLGVTQLGRVEAALHGVAINTDAVDNSAGVDSSDHEVNIKLLLRTLLNKGVFSAADREKVLLSFTDEVAERVLSNNYAQNVVLGEARAQTRAMSGTYGRMLGYLERHAELDRVVEFLPNADELAKREFPYYVSPELAVLLAYAKMHAADEILASEVPDEDWMNRELASYFPDALVSRFGELIPEHPLHREIATTKLVNRMVDRGGLTYVYRMLEETPASVPQIARVFVVVSEIFELDEFFDAVCALDNVVPTEVQVRLQHDYVRLLDRSSRWLVQQAPDTLDVDSGIEKYGRVVKALRSRVPELVRGYDAEVMAATAQEYIDEGVPSELAWRAAALLDEFALLDIAQLASRSSESAQDIAEVYYAVNDKFSGSQVLSLIGGLDRSDRWSALARGSLRDDFYSAILSVAGSVVSATESPVAGTPEERADERLAEWLERNETAAVRVLDTIDTVLGLDTVTQAPLSVLLRMMRGVVRSSDWESEHSA
ncbi:glutamate dehydrogenase (NAD) [Brevibacterium sanguinis]|uniref:Glutamate dehydrogenase (NAD) n=2 Tax=Brevibacterium TaxID=1696 RepID=A0A366IN83_9MICO|nr:MULTISPECIES: NAD-glutamate dehydrogenase [Brevibacterium]RBP66158.1 glutamate dehydrogenase (NAD) [Brevibacterium sanguinis]RBP72809.1 glutamate dehydrogenase (NAD) [Brevibacterium celere]